MAGMSSGTGNHRAPLAERGNDLYETPPEATWALLRHECLPSVIWEPACGPGAIVRVLRKAGHVVIATDLVDYGWGAQSGVDFLMETSSGGAECIVTNPPFKLAGEFVAHALDLGVPKVVMLLRLAFLESERRSSILDSGKLARVHIFRKRLPMMHRHGWEGRKSNSGMAFAWFVWDQAHDGPCVMNRISWQPADAAVQVAA